MKIHIATDHAGLDLKNDLVKYLSKNKHEVIDHGAHEFNGDDDYPDFVIPAAKAVVQDVKNGITAVGVVLGGSGNGEQIAANKVKGIRAALVWNNETARLARQHNNANIVSIGARMHEVAEIKEFIDTFVQEGFTEEERHLRRIEKIYEYELSN